LAVTGVFLAMATLALFAALSFGPFSIVAPIAGSYPALAMLFAVAQGARPSLAQWLAIAAVMGGVAIVSRSAGRYEASGDVPPGKLKALLGLAFVASLGFAVSLTAGQAAVPVFGEIETVWLSRIFGLAAIGALSVAVAQGRAAGLVAAFAGAHGLSRRGGHGHHPRRRQLAAPPPSPPWSHRPSAPSRCSWRAPSSRNRSRRRSLPAWC
jgi:drug/metabolite transporter (DMT)-like permease